MAKLTAKQAKFVDEYLVDLNATQAAIRAGYKKKAAYAIGAENLRKPQIKAALDQRMADRSERVEISQDRIVKELAKIALVDIRKAVRWGRSPIDDESTNLDKNGLGIYPVELVPSDEIDDDTAGAIAGVELTQTGVKIKTHDKLSALNLLGKHMGMFKERHEVTGADDGPVEIILTAPESV